MTKEENEEMVTVVNTVNRRTQSMLKTDAVLFLRKHTLFRLVEKAPIAEPKRKIRKVIKKQGKEFIKEESSTISRKRKEPDSGSGGPTPRSASVSEAGQDTKKRRGRGEAEQALVSIPVRVAPLITLSLSEMHEAVRLFTSSPPGCVDWQMISDAATGGRVPAADIEYAANEFLPHVHYRPSMGMVVMERQSRIPSEYSRHRQTLKRMKNGLNSLLSKLKNFCMQSSTDALPEEDIGGSGQENAELVKKRAEKAISRYERGEVPVYALRQAPVAKIDGEAGSLAATGRLRKRYETKAMRLTKQAVESSSSSPQPSSSSSSLVVVKSELGVATFSVPPFFHATAKQFAKSSASSVEDDQ